MKSFTVTLLILIFLIGDSCPQSIYRVTTPEQRGEDLSILSNKEILRRLAAIDLMEADKNEKPWENTKAVELRKIANILGERFFNNSFIPTKKEKKLLNKVISFHFDQALSDDFSWKSLEGMQQITRFFRLSAPFLLEEISNNDLARASLAANCLNKIMDEEIIKAVLKMYKNEKDVYSKRVYRILLEQTSSEIRNIVESRKKYVLNKEECERLYNDLVRPELEAIDRKSETAQRPEFIPYNYFLFTTSSKLL